MFVKAQKTRHSQYLLPLLLLAFAWRVQGLTRQSLWRDEVDAIYFALRELPATLGMFVQAAQNGPLYFLSLRFWFHLAGASEFALRYISVMAGVLIIPLLWQVTRRLVSSSCPPVHAAQDPEIQNPKSKIQNQLAPLLAVLLLAFNPYQLWYSQEGKMYTVITCLALVSHLCWLSGITRGGWRPWLAYLLTVSIAIYCHLLMILIIPVHFLWFFVAWPQSRSHWRGYGAALAGLTLPYLPMIWWQWEMLTTAQHATGFGFTPLAEMLRTLLINHSRGLLPPLDLIWYAPIFFLGITGIVLGMGSLVSTPTEMPTGTACKGLILPAWRRYLLILTWLLAPIAGIYLLSLRQPVFTDRYIIWAAPAAMILLALGGDALLRNGGVFGKPALGLLLLYILGFWSYSGWQQKTLPIKYDLRSAIQYVATRRDPTTLLILQIPHLEYSYRYYSSDFGTNLFVDSEARLGHWEHGLWTNAAGLSDEQARAQANEQMQTITAGLQDVWVITSEMEMWDSRHLMEAWLEAHGEVVERAEFHGAQARHYRLQ